MRVWVSLIINRKFSKDTFNIIDNLGLLNLIYHTMIRYIGGIFLYEMGRVGRHYKTN